MNSFLTWPRKKDDPVRRYWRPWYIVTWRLLWFVPVIVVKYIYISLVFIGWVKIMHMKF